MTEWSDPRRWTGVCPELARRFAWDVWAVRCAFLLAFVIQPLFAILAYLALALFLPRNGMAPVTDSLGSLDLGAGPSRKDPAEAERAARNARIEELERRFRELESEETQH